jgi:hypothetical protein
MKREDNRQHDSDKEEEPLEREFMDMDITFYLQEDGRVVVTDLPGELLDLIKKLDPDADIFCSFDNPMEDK